MKIISYISFLALLALSGCGAGDGCSFDSPRWETLPIVVEADIWQADDAIELWNERLDANVFVAGEGGVTITPVEPWELGGQGYYTREVDNGIITHAEITYVRDLSEYKTYLILSHELGHVLGIDCHIPLTVMGEVTLSTRITQEIIDYIYDLYPEI